MSERRTDLGALTLYAAADQTQLQASTGQLNIVAQLNQEIDKKRLTSVLKRIPAEDALYYLAKNQSIDSVVLQHFADYWDWATLSESQYLPWSLELIQDFLNNWYWGQEICDNLDGEEFYCYFGGLSGNEALPWSIELIEAYKNHWDWGILSRNSALPWSLDLINSFEGRWDWENLSWNKSLPWSFALIERFEDRWDWKHLSENIAIPWSMELLDRFHDQWDWSRVRANKAIPVSLDFAQRFCIS